jgi:hypothetical protein
MAEAVAYLKRARQNGHTLSEEFNFDKRLPVKFLIIAKVSCGKAP